MEGTIEGVDVTRVTGWFEEHVPSVKPPLAFDLIAGGHSNLTFGVRDESDGHWVLRRPRFGCHRRALPWPLRRLRSRGPVEEVGWRARSRASTSHG